MSSILEDSNSTWFLPSLWFRLVLINWLILSIVFNRLIKLLYMDILLQGLWNIFFFFDEFGTYFSVSRNPNVILIKLRTHKFHIHKFFKAICYTNFFFFFFSFFFFFFEKTQIRKKETHKYLIKKEIIRILLIR